MDEDIDQRIKFIQEVERHPYLYDQYHVMYNHRFKHETTWDKIGQTFGYTGAECKKRWRRIRCAYTRSLKRGLQRGDVAQTKGYYMAPHLRFLDPHLKTRSTAESALSDEDDSSDLPEETIDGYSCNPEDSLGTIKVEREDVESEHFEEFNEAKVAKNDCEPNLLVENKRPYEDDVDDVPQDSIKKLRHNYHEIPRRDLNSSEMYLLSMAPYLDDMTERQRLTFQQGVIELIQKIKYGSQ